MVDMAIKYKDKFQKTCIMIENVKKLGFDTREYEDVLASINNRVSKDIDTSYLSGKLVQGRMEQIYSSGIMELTKLWVALDRYSVYFEVLNACRYLDIELDGNDKTREEIEKYVTQMIYNLKRLVRSDTINYEKEKYIVEKVYDTAYNVIKLELVMTGDSQLYHYAKEEDVNVSFFNRLVLKELERLNLNDEKYSLIKSRMYKLDSNGIDSNYFDLELIKLLLVYGDNVDLMNIVEEKFSELRKCIESSDKDVFDGVQYVKYKETSVRQKYDDVVRARKRARKKFISMILAYTIMITSNIGVVRTGKKNNMVDSYIQHMETYSSLDGDTKYGFKEVSGNDLNVEDYVYVRWYHPWKYNEQGVMEREYSEYNVSHIDLDTSYDYYIYGVDNYDVDPIEKIEVYDGDISLNENVLYKGNHIEVEKGRFEDNGEVLDYYEYVDWLTPWIVSFFTCLMMYYGMRHAVSENVFFITGYLSKIKELISKKRILKKDILELHDAVNILMKQINSCEEYRNKYRELYEENKFLLDNPDELYRMINDIEKLDKIEDAKNLVRKYKKW